MYNTRYPFWRFVTGYFVHDVSEQRCVIKCKCGKSNINAFFLDFRLSYIYIYIYIYSSSSVGATARCVLWPVEQYLSTFPFLSPTLSIFSLPALEDLFLLLLSIFSWVFLFVSSLRVLEWRSFWASYPPPFSPGDPANLSFVSLSILLYFLLYSTLLVLDSSLTL